MTCRDFIEFLLDYESGALPSAERGVFDEHLAVCPACVNYLRTYQQTIALTQGATADEARELPADVPDELVAAIVAARQRGD